MPTINIEETSIIFYESPISRAYLKFFLDEKIKIKNFLYLNDKSFLPNKINAYKLYIRNNYYALKFLKDKNVIKLISQIEEFFLMPKNFCLNMYSFSNLEINKGIIYIPNKSINSKDVANILSQKKFLNNYILNTGNEILKDILNLNLNFFHIHPGYLPEVRGADGSLNSVLYKNSIGATSFIMTKKIDHGDILLREKYEYPRFKLDNYNDYCLKDIYRIWFCFFDPLLRVSHLKKLFEKKLIIIKEQDKSKIGDYYGFLDNDDLKKVFDKIFIQ